MKDVRDDAKGKRERTERKPESELLRRQRVLREHLEALARRSPEERFADLEARAVSAVRALGDELRRRRSEEDAAGFSFYRESDSLEGQAFRKLFEAFTGEPLGASDVGLVDAVKRSAAAAQAVARFWEERRVPAAERDLFAPQRLAEVLREIPDAPWAPEVAFALDLWRHPDADGPEIVLVPRADGALAVLNIGSRATTFGEWLGLSKGGRANRGHVIAPSSGDARDNERRSIAEALAAVVLRKCVGSASPGWRSGEARAAFLESFRDGLQRGPNLRRFRKETGLTVKAGAFRMALSRAVAAVVPEVESVTSRVSSHVTDGGPDSTREGSTLRNGARGCPVAAGHLPSPGTGGGPDSPREGSTPKGGTKSDNLPDHERSRRTSPRRTSDAAPVAVSGNRPEVRETEPRSVPVRRSRPRGVHAGEDVLLDRGGNRQPRDRRGGRVRKPP